MDADRRFCHHFFFLNILMLDRRLAVLPLVKCNISNTRSA